MADSDTSGPARDPDILTSEQVAQRLGIADAAVVRQLHAAGLPGMAVGQLLHSWRAVQAWTAGRALPEGEILTSGQVAQRLGVADAAVVRRSFEDGGVPGVLVGQVLLHSWQEVYAWLAGPGIPDGEILTARQLAERIGAQYQAVRRAAAPPGTPGRLPGQQVGGNGRWLFALEAVRAAIGAQAGGEPAG